MYKELKEVSTATFGGRKFRKQQIIDIQKTVSTFPGLSRSELAHTICEHVNWTTPRGTNRIQTCLNALEEMEASGIIRLPEKRAQIKKAKQRKIIYTDLTHNAQPIHCPLNELMPIHLQMVSEKEPIKQWNEFVDRYHYLGYRRPIGSHVRYFIIDRSGRKLGCLLFSFATVSLACRDQWIGWTQEHRQKHLNLVINNNRFLIFPWVNVKHLASKALAYATRQIGSDWEARHGYRPVLIETFVDPTQYKGTCYKAANWQYIGETAGRESKNDADIKSKKEIYLYPLDPDAREALTDIKKSPAKKVDPYKTANISPDSQVYLWQKIICIVAKVSEKFDQEWQKRQRIITTLLIILFIFRLVFSKNKQGYGSTISELWDYCRKLNVPLPQEKPVVPATFCNARKKLDEGVFKTLNLEIIQAYGTQQENLLWKTHRIFAVDGSKINLPKQLLNFSYKTPSDNAHYPQGMLSCLYQLMSKIPFDFELSSNLDERKLALGHLEVLQKNDIIVYDRGYFSYAMLHAHHKKGIHAVFRLAKNSIKSIDEFMSCADTERFITIDPNAHSQKEIRKKHPSIDIIPLQLRLIKYTINNVVYTLGTTLLDHEQYKADDFPDIYHARWGIEELYKISKVLIDVEDFHAQTVRGVKQELFAHFVIITLCRIFSNQTDDILLLRKSRDEPEKIKTNFKHCLLTVARYIEELFLQQITHIKNTITHITNSIMTCVQKERPNRSYVRQSHKVAKKWKPGKKRVRPLRTGL
ncbi:MAG: IS4 family transposase [bacterium]|nr:IS4 family transposase [bacterium]